jgi:uncharacterized damage-inducible protein DinB
MSVESLFLETSVAKLRQFTERIAVCLGKLNADQIWYRANENSNAVGNLVLHLAGNVRQWAVSGLGGKQDIRVRDLEFSTMGGLAPAELTSLIRTTIEEAAAVISALSTEQLTHVYEIQTRKVSGVEAIMNMVQHFAEHTGQIIFATKSLTGEDLALYAPRKTTSA